MTTHIWRERDAHKWPQHERGTESQHSRNVGHTKWSFHLEDSDDRPCSCFWSYDLTWFGISILSRNTADVTELPGDAGELWKLSIVKVLRVQTSLYVANISHCVIVVFLLWQFVRAVWICKCVLQNPPVTCAVGYFCVTLLWIDKGMSFCWHSQVLSAFASVVLMRKCWDLFRPQCLDPVTIKKTYLIHSWPN